MSWITRCPDCDTVYKVESEQLQQAHGWLRCGTCQHVFDSTGRVVAADVIPTLNDRVNVGAPQIGRVDVERLLHKESPSPVVSATPLAAEPGVPASPQPSPIDDFDDALQSFKPPDVLGQTRPGQEAPGEDAGPSDAPAAAADPGPVTAPGPKRRPSRALTAVALFLVLLLALQWLWAWRSTLLGYWPQLSRVAQAWCGTSACRAQWQAPLSVWTLQAQALTPEGEAVQLQWTLGHASAEALPVPDLSLVLFNAQGQTVYSERLTAAMTAAPADLGPGQTWQGSLRLELAAGVEASRAQLRLIPR